MAFNPVLDPDKEKRLNDWLMQSHSTDTPNATPMPPPPTAFEADKTEDTNDQAMEKVETSNPGLQPNELDKFLGQEKTQSERFGPDQEAAVMKNLQEGYRKPGYVLAKGAAGLGDAIMQGVARAGSSNFLNTVQNQEQNAIKNASDQFSHLQETNMKDIANKERMAGMTSSSPLGRSYIDTLKPLAQKLFPQMTEEVWEKISRNPKALKDMIGPSIDMAKVEGELAMKDATLGIQSENYRSQRSQQDENSKLAREKEEVDAAREILKGSKIPFVGPSHAEKVAAQKKITQMAGVGGPKVMTATNPKTGKKIMSRDGGKTWE